MHIVIASVIGDNLAVNKIMGFTTSFSATHFCRRCKRDKNSTQTDCEEYAAFLRNEENYEIDIKMKNVAETGLKEESVLNKIPSFHVVDNVVFDIMHDIFEGVAQYDLCASLKYFVKTKKYFTLDTFNYRKQMFNYGETEIGNICAEVDMKMLDNANIKSSAREMMTLIHFLPIIIGDLVPRNDKVWKFICVFLEIVAIVLKNTLTENDLTNLKKYVQIHNNSYQKLFNLTLKPKQHFLVHYPNAIRKSGPLRNLWCFRFESKLRELKIYARSIASRRNTPLSLAIKSMLHFSFHCISTDLLSHEISFNQLPVTTKILQILKKENLDDNEVIASSVTFRNTLYKQGYFLTAHPNSGPLPLLFEIEHLMVKSCEVYIICKRWNILSYDQHFKSYIVGSKEEQYIVKHILDFDALPIHLYYIPTGMKVIRIKNYFN